MAESLNGQKFRTTYCHYILNRSIRLCNHQRRIGHISVGSGNKTKEYSFAAEFVSFGIAYPCL